MGAGVVAGVGNNTDRGEAITASAIAEGEAGWIPFIKGSSPEKPKVTVVYCDASLIRLKVKVFGMWFGEVKHKGQVFTRIALPGYGSSDEIGKADIPVIREMLQIPYGAEASVHVVRVSEAEFPLELLGIHNRIEPDQPSHPISGPKPGFVLDKSFYHADDFYPDQIAKLGLVGTIRGCRFAQIQIAPIMHNPKAGTIKIYPELELEIRLSGSDMAGTNQMLTRYASRPFEALFKSLFLNYGAFGKDVEPPPTPPGYLAITPDGYAETLSRLVEWKKKKGFHVTVAKTSEIGSTRDEIKAYIDSAYNNWEIPPTYLLLVGDVDSIPTYPCSVLCTATDLHYVLITPDTLAADIHRGRLPAQDSTELGHMIDKILAYERVLFDSLEWMNKFCLIKGPRYPGNGDDIPPRDSVVFLRCIADDMQCDTLETDGTGPATGADITDAINDGRSLVTYTDHGAIGKWNHPSYDQNAVRALVNENKYPFILSLCCHTGEFNEDECFGETWIKEEEKGAIAFWGGSGPTGFDYNDVIENGIYTALCEEDIYTVSGAADRGLLDLYGEFNSESSDFRRHFESYNILGDPAIDLWMDVCDSLTVDYDPHIEVGQNRYRVRVRNNGSPVSDALVSLLKEDDLFKSQYTASTGYATFSIEPVEAGTMHVTVTCHNCRPHEGTVGVWDFLICGDVNSDTEVDSCDVDYLSAYLWSSGPAPEPVCLGDVDCDGDVDLGDVVYLINYVNQGGDPPCDECCD
jgi:hypothetical protein